MKRIILCTIPGTGTHFFKKLLEDHGFDVKRWDSNPQDPDRPSVLKTDAYSNSATPPYSLKKISSHPESNRESLPCKGSK